MLMPQNTRVSLVAAVVIVTLSSCSIVPPRTNPPEVRTFSAEMPAPPTQGSRARAETALKVRLGRVTAAENLRTRIVHRDSPLELGEYQTLRWSEEPEEFVKRSLSRALFQERGLEQGLLGNLPTVDVEVLAFEEVRKGASRAGRVELHYSLHDDHVVMSSGDLVVEHDAASADIGAVVAAISSALSDATAQVADAIVNRLQKPSDGTVAPESGR
jgi:cholesterol transport system auxiliary component